MQDKAANGSRHPVLPLRYAPFFSFNPVTVYEAFKLVLLTPLAIVRCVLLVLVLLLWILLLSIALCCTKTNTDDPLPHSRRDCIGCISKSMAAVCLVLLGFWSSCDGRLQPDSRARIAVFNHPGWIDAFLIIRYCAPCSSVAAAFIKRIPLISTIAAAHQ